MEDRVVSRKEMFDRFAETVGADAFSSSEWTTILKGIGAIFDLQLTAPQPVAGIDEAVNSEDFRRPEFEAWAVDRMLTVKKHKSGAHIRYESDLTETAWSAWRDSAYALSALKEAR